MNAPKIRADDTGLVLISLVFVGPKTPWGWLGIFPLVIGTIAYCPPYALFGINTCKAEEKNP